MFTTRSGFLLAIVLLVGLSGCLASVNPPSTISTSTPALTVTPHSTSTPITPTWTAVVLPTSSSTIVPAVPDDERIIANIDVGGRPGPMALGNGSLWVIVDHSSIVQIDPQTHEVVGKPIPLAVPVSVPYEAELLAIAFGQDSVWVSIVGAGDSDRPNPVDSVLRIDAQTGKNLARIHVPRGPMSLAYTPGFVWVVNFGLNHQTVSRIDVMTNQLADEAVKTGHAPYGMTVGEGSVWVVNHDDGTLTRIDPERNQVIANIPLPAEPHRVAVGDGAVWVGNWHDSSVSRVDPQTNQVIGEPIPIGYHAGNIAAGNGNVWVTSDYRGVEAFPAPIPGHVVLMRIDPKTNKLVDTIPLGGYPVDVEVTEDAAWVSIQNPDRVLKIQP